MRSRSLVVAVALVAAACSTTHETAPKPSAPAVGYGTPIMRIRPLAGSNPVN